MTPIEATNIAAKIVTVTGGKYYGTASPSERGKTLVWVFDCETRHHITSITSCSDFAHWIGNF